ncbi:MAG: hypothetical protein KC620_20600, partial [Myxococcales bacterium]|nr:hypothetical protein [Myxococcales bacterium]
CDGVVDEPFDVGADCVLGLGACARDGVRACGPDGEGLCQADVGSPADELCNAIDDDCDGITDEDFGGGMPCAEGVG